MRPDDPVRAFVGLGGNQGDVETTLVEALINSLTIAALTALGQPAPELDLVFFLQQSA